MRTKTAPGIPATCTVEREEFDQSFSGSRCRTVVLVVIINLVNVDNVFLVGLFLIIALTATVTANLPNLTSQRTSCAMQHVRQKTSTGRPGAERQVSEGSIFSLLRTANRSVHSNEVCTLIPTPGFTFFSVSAFRHTLTHCAHSQHFYGSRSDCQNPSIKSFLLICLT